MVIGPGLNSSGTSFYYFLQQHYVLGLSKWLEMPICQGTFNLKADLRNPLTY